jgi:MraZ protein
LLKQRSRIPRREGQGMFRGNQEYQLDDRNRVAIPARYRDHFNAGAVLTPGLERCVAVYTVEGYEARAAVLEQVAAESEEGRKLRRAFFGNSFDVQKDNQGRLLIPAKLMTYAGLQAKSDVMIVGTQECLEIWDKTMWDAQEEDFTGAFVAVVNRIGAMKNRAFNGQGE